MAVGGTSICSCVGMKDGIYVTGC